MDELRKQFPDTYALAEESIDKIDVPLDQIEDWKLERFSDQMDQFNRKFDEDLRTALIIRCLENNGMKIGLPSNEILMAMFDLIENTAILNYHLIMNEDIRPYWLRFHLKI